MSLEQILGDFTSIKEKGFNTNSYNLDNLFRMYRGCLKF